MQGERLDVVLKEILGGANAFSVGVFFILLGVFFLAEQQGWVTPDFPFWPIISIVFGVYLLGGKNRAL